MVAKVLIADDDAHVRRVLCRSFERAGYEVAAAQDGREALETCGHFRPDLLVTDLAMPGLHGLDLCRMLASDPATAGVPAIIITARDFLPDMLRGVCPSIRGVFAKPFSPTAVVRAAARVLATPAVPATAAPEAPLDVLGLLRQLPLARVSHD